MKRIYLILGVVLFGFITPVNAQSQTERIKDYKAMKKLTESELNQKATKSARAEAKKLKKDGWLTAPGALPVEKQLDRSYRMQMEMDDDFLPVYMMGEGMSIGENYDAAKMQAIVGTMNPVHLKEICDAAKFDLTHNEWYHLYLASGKTLP